jgi:hypothetical protein
LESLFNILCLSGRQTFFKSAENLTNQRKVPIYFQSGGGGIRHSNPGQKKKEREKERKMWGKKGGKCERKKKKG